MNAEILLNSTDNLLAYKGKLVKVVPVQEVKIQFKISPRKGRGLVVKSV